MSEPRARSDGPRAYRPPQTPQEAAQAAAHEAERRSSETRRKALAWAEAKLPGEDPALAAGATLTLRHALGRMPSPDEVRARLRANENTTAEEAT